MPTGVPSLSRNPLKRKGEAEALIAAGLPEGEFIQHFSMAQLGPTTAVFLAVTNRRLLMATHANFEVDPIGEVVFDEPVAALGARLSSGLLAKVSVIERESGKDYGSLNFGLRRTAAHDFADALGRLQ